MRFRGVSYLLRLTQVVKGWSLSENLSLHISKVPVLPITLHPRHLHLMAVVVYIIVSLARHILLLLRRDKAGLGVREVRLGTSVQQPFLGQS